jgi:peroxiredoxin
MNSVKFLILPFLLACAASTSAKDDLSKDLDKKVAAATLVEQFQAAPDFTCKTTDGRDFTLSAQKGKVVLLYFFSTSNAACITEMRYLETEIHQKLKGRGDFQIIAIGRGHEREELVKLAGERHYTFSFVPDPKQEIYGRYFARFVPRKVVVRRDGTIAYLASGYKEFEGILQLQELLARELAVKP